MGSFYKEPLYPIWVLGSQSHFTVMFSFDRRANEPEPSSAARRAFDKHDATGAGMIPKDAVDKVVEDLRLPIARQPLQLSLLHDKLDQGMGQCLWADFWEEISPMVRDPEPGKAPYVVVDESETEREARALFTSFDQLGGGFLQSSQAAELVESLGASSQCCVLLLVLLLSRVTQFHAVHCVISCRIFG